MVMTSDLPVVCSTQETWTEPSLQHKETMMHKKSHQVTHDLMLSGWIPFHSHYGVDVVLLLLGLQVSQDNLYKHIHDSFQTLTVSQLHSHYVNSTCSPESGRGRGQKRLFDVVLMCFCTFASFSGCSAATLW